MLTRQPALVRQVRPAYGAKLKDVKDDRNKYDKYQSELDQLNMTLRQAGRRRPNPGPA